MEVKSRSFFFKGWAGIGLVAFVMVWNLPWRFQVNDDEVMMWLVSGAYTGKPEPFAVFLHPILSWTFSKLYIISPKFPWYSTTWFLIMFLSYLGIIKVIAFRAIDDIQKQVWALFLFGFFVHFLFFLQFSVVAALSISAGLGLRLINWDWCQKSWINLRYSDLFILIGYLIRPDVLILFLIGIVGLNFLVLRKKSLYLGLVLPVLLSIFGSLTMILWIERAGLREFYETNRLRSQVFDHPSLQLHKEEFKTSDPDLYYFANGLIDFNRDPSLPQKLQIWKNELDEKRFLNMNLKSIANSLSIFLRHEKFFVGLVVFFLIFSFMVNWKKSLPMFLIIIPGLIILSPFYLLKIQIIAIVFLLYFILCIGTLDLQRPLNKVWSLYILILCGAIIFHFISFFKSIKNIPSGHILSQAIERVQSEGIKDVYLVSSGNLYRELMFDSPLRFKILGWPTLLESHNGFESSGRKAYLIDSNTYYNNMGYFNTEVKKEGTSEVILLTIE